MGSGKWVSQSAPYVIPAVNGAPDAWTAEAAVHGARGSNRLTFAGEAPAPAFVAEVFDIAAQSSVVVRRRVVYLNDAPMEIATSYYPEAIASGTPLENPRKIKGGAITYLAELGYVTKSVTEEVTAHMPDDDLRAELQLTEGEPVVTIHRANRDATGRTFQAEIMTAPAKTRRLRYEMEVG